MRAALFKCKELGINKIRCESDSKKLISCIKKKTSWPDIFGPVSDILSMATECDSISFDWIEREKNTIADNLAKLSLVINEDVHPLT